MQNYKKLDPGVLKDWDFVKAHSHKHAPDDIWGKGVATNFNAKPNEKKHGLLKKVYQRQTNFKDVEPQVSV